MPILQNIAEVNSLLYTEDQTPPWSIADRTRTDEQTPRHSEYYHPTWPPKW